MQKHTILYWLGIIIPTVCLAGIIMIIGLGLWDMANTKVDLTATAYAIMVTAAIGMAAAAKYFDGVRKTSRQLASLDEYGRTKTQYKDLSNEERRVVNRMNLAANQASLPNSELLNMTHKGSEDPDKDLSELVGLSNIKEKVLEMKAQMMYGKKNGNVPVKAVFLGDPGTGKTTVAAIMTGYCRKYRRIRKNEFIVANGASFVSSADPVRRMQLILQSAKGRVLFIDEAYAIAYSPYGPQLLTLILNEMEEHRNEMGLIMAGYREDMRKLFDMNQGLSSRFTDFFFFENYSLEEMRKIESSMARRRGYTFSDEALTASEPIFLHQADRGIFANARSARQVTEDAIARHMYRRMTGETKEKYIIEKEDIIEKVDVQDYFSLDGT